MSTWEAIFSQSPVNEGFYDEQQIPQLHWDWPRKTWFQSRRDFLRDHEQNSLKTSRKLKVNSNLRSM
jgi:hypothetical protein